MLSRYDSALSGLFDLIVIVKQLHQTLMKLFHDNNEIKQADQTSSEGEIVRSQWVPGLVSMVDWM